MGWKKSSFQSLSDVHDHFLHNFLLILIFVSDFTRLHRLLPNFIFMSLIWFVVLLEEFMSAFSSLHNVREHFMGTRSLPGILNMSNINLNFAFSSTSSRSLVRSCALLRAETHTSNI